MDDRTGLPPNAEELLARVRARLVAADPPRERLGNVVVPRLLRGLRSPKIVPGEEVWRLGVLLIGDRDVFAEGTVVRAGDPGRRGFASEATRARAERAAAAMRGGFRQGESVHLEWTRLDLGALGRGGVVGPLIESRGEPRVRWSATAGHVALADYLDERFLLLVRPSEGA